MTDNPPIVVFDHSVFGPNLCEFDVSVLVIIIELQTKIV